MSETNEISSEPRPFQLSMADGTGTWTLYITPGNIARGLATYPNGDKYSGDFVNGDRVGKGTYNYSNGDVYTGQFDMGQKHGLGKVEYVTPNHQEESAKPAITASYYGTFVKGIRHGDGTYKYPNGDIYTGGWCNGLKQGSGTYLFGIDGGKLVGAWADGRLVEGSWVLPDGNQLVSASFVDNKPCGKSTWVLNNDRGSFNGSYMHVTDEEGKGLMKWEFEPFFTL